MSIQVYFIKKGNELVSWNNWKQNSLPETKAKERYEEQRHMLVIKAKVYK